MDLREKLVEQLKWWATECDRTNNGCQARKLLIEAANELANGVTVQEWISVKDRLPEETGRLDGYLVSTGLWVGIMVFVNGEFQNWTPQEGLTKPKFTVNAWMPLPNAEGLK